MKAFLFSSALLTCLAAESSRRQPVPAVLRTVTDASESAAPAVAVTIRNTDTGVERKTETNAAGLYNAAILAPGQLRDTGG
jgi:hypothetical protein